LPTLNNSEIRLLFYPTARFAHGRTFRCVRVFACKNKKDTTGLKRCLPRLRFCRVLLFLHFSNFDLSRNQNLFNLLLSPFCSPSFSQNRTLFVRHCHRRTAKRILTFCRFFMQKSLTFEAFLLFLDVYSFMFATHSAILGVYGLNRRVIFLFVLCQIIYRAISLTTGYIVYQ